MGHERPPGEDSGADQNAIERALRRKYSGGDPAAFAELWRRHSPSLLAYAQRWGDQNFARDAIERLAVQLREPETRARCAPDCSWPEWALQLLRRMNENVLQRMYSQGDGAAFDDLWFLHHDRLLKRAQKYFGAGADDALSTLAVTLAEPGTKRQYQPQAPWYAWADSILRKRGIDSHRKRWRAGWVLSSKLLLELRAKGWADQVLRNLEKLKGKWFTSEQTFRTELLRAGVEQSDHDYVVEQACRRGSERERLDQVEPVSRRPEESMYEWCGGAVFAEDVRDCLKTLNDQQQAVVCFRDWEGRTYADIGQLRGDADHNAAYRDHQDAMTQLKKCLKLKGRQRRRRGRGPRNGNSVPEDGI